MSIEHQVLNSKIGEKAGTNCKGSYAIDQACEGRKERI